MSKELLDEAVALLDRFLTDGEYNDEGDYVFVSDTPESGPLAEPDTVIPRLVLDVAAFLRKAGVKV